MYVLSKHHTFQTTGSVTHVWLQTFGLWETYLSESEVTISSNWKSYSMEAPRMKTLMLKSPEVEALCSLLRKVSSLSVNCAGSVSLFTFVFLEVATYGSA